MGNSKWTFQPLAELCEINVGKTPSRSKNEYWGEGHPWASISDLKSKNIKNTREEITDLALSDTNIRMVKKGTLLMSFKLSIGKLAFAGKDLYTNEAIVALPVKRGVQLDKNYLYYVLGFIPLAGGNQAAMGKTLNKKSLAALSIPLPPTIEDQKRIAKILSDCEALIQKRKDSIDLLDDLRISNYYKMFGSPVGNEKNWNIELLGRICHVGSGKRVFVDELVDSGIPFFRGTEIGALSEGKSIKPKLFITEEHYQTLKEQTGIPNIGDLLLPSICPDGRIYRVSDSKPFYFKDGRVLWIKVDETAIASRYLRETLKEIFRTNYKNIASGTTFAELKIFALKKMKIPVPPSDLQLKFDHILEQIESMRSIFTKSLEELMNLKWSINQRIFKGEFDLSKVDISDMEESKKKVETEVEDEKIMSEEESAKQKKQIEEIISSETGNKSYLTENVLSYINQSKELRSIICASTKNYRLDTSGLKRLWEINKLGAEIADEVNKFAPWQVDQHKSVERYIPMLPEEILQEFPNINIFSRNDFDYSAMTLDDYYGIPDEVISKYGSIENAIIDLDFFFKKYFSNQLFTINDVRNLYDQVVYEQGDWFKYEEMKEYIFKSLEGEDGLLTQEFIEFETINPDSGKKEILKEIKLKVI